MVNNQKPDPRAGGQTKNPFRFYTRLNLLELTGDKAHNIYELLTYLEKAPDAVIYHHTHHYLQQHIYLSPEPPNDFAYWVKRTLGEAVLAEKLESIDLCDYNNMDSLRQKITSVIREHIPEGVQCVRDVWPGQEFHFIKAITFVLPTNYVVYNLAKFRHILRKITVHSLYFHIFEARLRLKQPTNDFSLWFSDSLGETELAREVERLDPYTYTMESLREKISDLITERLVNKKEKL